MRWIIALAFVAGLAACSSPAERGYDLAVQTSAERESILNPPPAERECRKQAQAALASDRLSGQSDLAARNADSTYQSCLSINGE
jgi:hypothetical protein